MHCAVSSCKIAPCLFLGIVLADPEIPLDATLIPSPSPQPKNPVFDDEKKSKVRGTILG